MTANRYNNRRIAETAATTRYSYEELEAAAIEYGSLFVDVFAREANRLNVDLAVVVAAVCSEKVGAKP